MYNGQRLTAVQLATVKTELQTDPEALGYTSFLTAGDWVSLAIIMDWIRDGITACPTNGVIGPNGAITNATNATPIVITSTAHGRATGDQVLIQNVGGNTAANGIFTITVANANSFSLDGSAGNAAYTSGGTWNWIINKVRQTSVSQLSIMGAIDVRDWPGWGVVTGTATPQQSAQLIFLQALFNQPSGTVQLTNPDGTDNNIAKNIKKCIGNAQGSTTAVTALESRLGSRAEDILNLSAPTPGFLLTWPDMYATINGSYPGGF